MAKVGAFFKKIGLWLKNHAPTKRRLIQLYAALLTNANLKGFATGKIYQGATKNLCVPGLNCYSCPGAIGACPLGALQDSLAQSSTRAPVYILGILALLGIMLGRTICGFLCPVGLFQELLYKIKTPKLKKSRVTRVLSYFKYVLLVVLVVAIPLLYHGIPAFCKYICPAGTFEGALGLLQNEENESYFGMLGFLFSWKFILLVAIVVGSIFIFRMFCRFFCPLGAIYGFFCKIALLGVKLDTSKCIDCGACLNKCKMDIKHVGDHECIHCGECIPVCPVHAIEFKGSRLVLQPTSILQEPPKEDVKPLSSFLKTSEGAAAPEGITPHEATEEAKKEEIESPVEPQGSVAQPEATVVAAEVQESASPAKQASAAAYARKLNKRGFILQIVAWAIALIVLVGALVYYNAFEGRASETLGKCPAMTLQTYETAYEGDTFSAGDTEQLTVLTFWRTKSAESVLAMPDFETVRKEYGDKISVCAIHIEGEAPWADVQSAISANGWSEYGMAFAQDTKEINAYEALGGNGAYPMTVIVDIHGDIVSRRVGAYDAAMLKEDIDKAISSTVYRVGDRCPDLTFAAYSSASGKEEFSFTACKGKTLVINFWYTTCDPCVAELPYFETVFEEYGGQIEMVALHSNNGTKKEDVQAFLDTKGWNAWQMTFAQDTAETRAYEKLGGRGAYPTTIIVGKDGRIKKIQPGKFEEAALREAIAEAENS